jgi:hypothetical protein
MNDSSPLSSPSTGHSRSPWNKDKIIRAKAATAIGACLVHSGQVAP